MSYVAGQILNKVAGSLAKWLRDCGFGNAIINDISRAIPIALVLIITGVMLFISVRLLIKQLRLGRRIMPIMATCAHIACFCIVVSLTLEQMFANLLFGVSSGLDVAFGGVNKVLEWITYGSGGPMLVLSILFWSCVYVAIADMFYTLFAAYTVKDKYDREDMGDAIVLERMLTMAYVVLALVLAIALL